MQRKHLQLSRHPDHGEDLRALSGSLLLAAGVAVLGSAAVLAACGGPPAGQVSFSEGENSASSTDKDSPSSSGGTSGGAAAGAGGPKDTIFGTDAFAAGTPQNGPAKGKPDHSAVNAQLDPSGQDCMQSACHASNGAKFGFGGTIYVDANGSAPVAGAEIRVVGPQGKTFGSTFSDADGNFWFESPTPAPEGSHVGVRNGSNEMTMVETIGGVTASGCNGGGSCHGSPTFRVNLPAK
jgi:hypothetical protein